MHSFTGRYRSRRPRGVRLREIEAANCDPNVRVAVVHYPSIKMIHVNLTHVDHDNERTIEWEFTAPDTLIGDADPAVALARIFAWIGSIDA